MKKLFLIHALSAGILAGWSQPPREIVRTIIVDAGKVQGRLNRGFNQCVGAGRANEGLRADWQRQLRYTKDQLGFR
jgi:xylan 1,4-beta-xylosidase